MYYIFKKKKNLVNLKWLRLYKYYIYIVIYILIYYKLKISNYKLSLNGWRGRNTVSNTVTVIYRKLYRNVMIYHNIIPYKVLHYSLLKLLI